MTDAFDRDQRAETGPKVQLILADQAAVVHGKLNIIGGGWSVMGPAPTTAALGVTIEVPWSEDPTGHTWRLWLVDADGRQVVCADHGTHPIERHGHILLERHADWSPGSPTGAVLAVQFGELSVAPGRYVWCFELDGASNSLWRVAFRCRDATT